jgi:hypothetical protein
VLHLDHRERPAVTGALGESRAVVLDRRGVAAQHDRALLAAPGGPIEHGGRPQIEL